MNGRRRLRGGFGVWLADHRSADGVLYRRYLKAGEEAVGGINGSALVRFDIEQYARAGVLYDQATRHWADLLRLRRTGKGRRPSERRVERAARRVGLADQTLKDALARLETVARQRRPQDLASLVPRKADQEPAPHRVTQAQTSGPSNFGLPESEG